MNRRDYQLLGLAFLFLFPSEISGQRGEPIGSVMFYNLENLYDTKDDSLKKDEEFTPEGDRHWSGYRLSHKLTAISKVIINTGNWEPPALIGFCEVENRNVLEQLVNHPILKPYNYAIIHKDSPDKRGIDVAAIYRPDIFHPLSYRYFSIAEAHEPVPETREILYLCGTLGTATVPGNRDTLHLFFNHWPSRYGGLMETRPKRMKAARRLKAETITLQRTYQHPMIIISGDFNDQPHDESLLAGLRAAHAPAHHPDSLFNLSHVWQKTGKGTLKYQSQWNVFDQFIVSEALLDTSNLPGTKAGFFALPADARILNAPFLLEEDEKFAGSRLRRTYQGYRYQGGTSDHLPILLTIRKKE